MIYNKQEVLLDTAAAAASCTEAEKSPWLRIHFHCMQLNNGEVTGLLELFEDHLWGSDPLECAGLSSCWRAPA
jgi:hypothetical protein